MAKHNMSLVDQLLQRQAILRTMTDAFRMFEASVEQPRLVETPSGLNMRYVQKTIQQAIVQKFARHLSALNSAELLIEHGFIQELSIICRAIDETEEDINFLSLALVNKDLTDRHQKFLDYFWQEEFDNISPIKSKQDRGAIPRDKIRSYIIEKSGCADPFTASEAGKTLYKAFSGYVHGASPQIMDMYVGNPPHFNTEGVKDTHRIFSYNYNIWNYFYRGLMASNIVAHAFQMNDLSAKIYNQVCDLET